MTGNSLFTSQQATCSQCLQSPSKIIVSYILSLRNYIGILLLLIKIVIKSAFIHVNCVCHTILSRILLNFNTIISVVYSAEPSIRCMHIALYCSALWCILLCCIALYCVDLHCIALHCIALHCTTLHYVSLYSIV